MENKVNYALVGLFVMLLSFALVAAIFWLSASTESKLYDVYQAFMRESVSGLSEGAVVKYRGVDVGKVRKITLSPDNPEEVRLLFEIERGTPVKQDTVAILKTQGLTGLAYVELTGGTKTAPPPAATAGQRYPEIQTGPSLLVRIDSAISLLLERMQEMSEAAGTFLVGLNNLSTSANTLLSPENRTAITHILESTQHLMDGLAARSDTLDRGVDDAAVILRNGAALSAELPLLLTQFRASAEALQATADQATGILQDNRRNIAQTVKGVARTAESLEKTSARSGQDMEQFTRTLLPEFTALLVELRETLQNLRQLSQQVERQPNTVIFGRPTPAPGPGE